VRVLLVTPDFPPAHGGIQQLAARLGEHLDAVTRVVTLGPRHNGNQPGGSPRGAVHRAWSPRPSGVAAAAALNVAALWIGLSEPPDVILSLHLFAAPGSLALARALGRPWVQWVHAKEVPEKPALARFALRRANAVVAVSDYSRTLAVDAGADRRLVRIVSPGVDVGGCVPGTRRAERPTVLTVSRLVDRYKGHDSLVRAMPLVASRVPRVRWVVVGDGPLRGPLEALALSTGASAQFVGDLPDRERDRWLDRAHVFAMPSRLPGGGFGGEGFGIVFLEAGLHGLPVIAGDVGGARDAIVHRETGLLIDPNDHIALADALTDLLTDPERAARLGRAGAERAREHAWPAAAARVREVLDEVAVG
jgi:phosphatidylinositol alpha-1,6-mannosyltransferase